MNQQQQVLNRIEKHKRIEESNQPILAKYGSGEISFEKAVNDFTKNTVSILVNIPVSRIERSQDRDASEARMICYYIVRKTCDLSVRKMQDMYGISYGAIHRKLKQIDFYVEKKKYNDILVIVEYVLLEIERKIKAFYLINQPHDGGQHTVISGRYSQL